MALEVFSITPATSLDLEGAGFTTKIADGTSYSISDTDFRERHGLLQRWSSDGISRNTVLDNFNRFYNIYPDMEMAQDLKSYIFVTRPEMNLLGDGTNGLVSDNENDIRLVYMQMQNPELLKMLTTSYSSDHQFIPYLQGRATSMQLPDYEIRTSEVTVPFYNYKFPYPTVTNESTTGGTFSISFKEDDDLRISKLFNFWIYYQDATAKNIMKIASKHKYDHAYDYMCSVYQVICDPTSANVVFWAKYTGCFPTNVPNSNMSHNLRSSVSNEVSINFSYSRVEVFSPAILNDFTINTPGASASLDDYESTYDEEFGMTGQSLVSCPVLTLSTTTGKLLLKWMPVTKTGGSTTVASSTSVLENYQLARNSSAAVASALSGITATTSKSGTSTTSTINFKYNSDNF